MLNTKTERGLRLAESLKNLDGLALLTLLEVSLAGDPLDCIGQHAVQPSLRPGQLHPRHAGRAVNLGSTELGQA